MVPLLALSTFRHVRGKHAYDDRMASLNIEDPFENGCILSPRLDVSDLGAVKDLCSLLLPFGLGTLFVTPESETAGYYWRDVHSTELVERRPKFCCFM